MGAHRVAIVDPLGLLGKELRRLLPGSGVVVAETVLLGRPGVEGTLSEYEGEAHVVQPVSEETLEPATMVFFCGSPELLAAHLPGLAARGAVVVDLTGTLALGPGRAVVVAGVNERETREARLLRGPHPATVLLASVLHEAGAELAVERVSAVFLEPASEIGEAAVEELYEQTRELLSFRPAPTAELGRRIAFDASPRWGAELAPREARVREEVRAVLGRSAPLVALSVLRLPIFIGASLLATLELEAEEDAPLVAEALAGSKLVCAASEPVSPGDLPDDPGDPIFVAVEPEVQDGRVRVWAAADALRRCLVRNALDVLARRAGLGA